MENLRGALFSSFFKPLRVERNTIPPTAHGYELPSCPSGENLGTSHTKNPILCSKILRYTLRVSCHFRNQLFQRGGRQSDGIIDNRYMPLGTRFRFSHTTHVSHILETREECLQGGKKGGLVQV